MIYLILAGKICGWVVALFIAVGVIDFVQWRREKARNRDRVDGYDAESLKAEGERLK